MAEIIIAGEPFNVIVEGEENAPAIVLAHSLGTNLHVFDRQAAALKPHFRVVRYDARGHGGSVASHGPYSISQLGNDALAILDALNLDKVHFGGLAAGGLTGLWLLNNAPERIERAVLANTAAQIGSAEIWNERINAVHERGVEALAPSLIENWFTRSFRERHPEEVHRFENALAATSGEGYAASAAAVRDANFREHLDRIRHPVLVIVGRHDPVTPPGVGALLANAIDRAKLVTLEAAHLSPVEAAEAFNDAILEFLTGADEKPSKPAHDESGAETPRHETVPKKPRKPRAARPKPLPAAKTRAAPAPVAASEPKTPEAPARPVHAAAPKKPSVRKAAAKKRAVKKTAAKKVAAKKVAAKRAVAKKAVKKAAAKKTARKVVTKKRPVRKTAAKKTASRRVVAKKRPVKKTARKTAIKKSAHRKAAKKTVARKYSVRKPARRPGGRRPRR